MPSTQGGMGPQNLAGKARRGVAHHIYRCGKGLYNQPRSPTAETDMSPTNPNSLGVWRQFKHRFLAWQDGSTFRLDLPNLSDDILRDIGLSYSTERFKPAMPFWVP
jgi:uncharacterized protein YjiS (DUF1127 family)